MILESKPIFLKKFSENVILLFVPWINRKLFASGSSYINAANTKFWLAITFVIS